MNGHEDVADYLTIERFTRAAKKGDLKTLQELIEKGVDVNAKDGYGRTALIRMAYNGRKEVAEWLIENGADVNAADNDGDTALMNASIGGNKDVAELLIAKKADVNAKNEDGKTALINACQNHEHDMVEFLIKNKADVNARDNQGNSAIIHATSSFCRLQATGNGDFDAFHPDIEEDKSVRLLVENGADVNDKDRDGRSVLAQAADFGQIKIVKFLLDAKADVNGGYPLPLNRAFSAGCFYYDNEDVIKLLIENGAKATLTTAELERAKENYPECVAMLEQAHKQAEKKDPNAVKAFAAKHEVVAPSASAAPERKIPATAMMQKILVKDAQSKK